MRFAGRINGFEGSHVLSATVNRLRLISGRSDARPDCHRDAAAHGVKPAAVRERATLDREALAHRTRLIAKRARAMSSF